MDWVYLHSLMNMLDLINLADQKANVEKGPIALQVPNEIGKSKMAPQSALLCWVEEVKGGKRCHRNS